MEKSEQLIAEINMNEITSIEDMVNEMRKNIEKQFNTGPIIGECLDVINSLIENILTRDIIFDVLKVDIRMRKNCFDTAMSVLQKRFDANKKKKGE